MLHVALLGFGMHAVKIAIRSLVRLHSSLIITGSAMVAVLDFGAFTFLSMYLLHFLDGMILYTK